MKSKLVQQLPDPLPQRQVTATTGKSTANGWKPPVVTHTDRTATAAGSSISGIASTDNSMAVVTPGRGCRACCDIWVFLLCMIVMLTQLLVFDYYFIRYMQEEWFYAWLAGDVIVLGVMIWLLVIAVRYNQRCMQEVCTSDANIKYAFIGWAAYSLLLVAKVATTFQLYYEAIADDNVFGANAFKLNLGLAAVVFLLLVEAHHYTQLNSPRQTYISYLQSVVTLDILDSIYFLEILWLGKANNWSLELWVEIVVLVLACVNFILPTFALLRLRWRRMPHWLLLPYAKLYSLLYVLFVNVPYLGMRIYLWVVLVQPHTFAVEFKPDPLQPLDAQPGAEDGQGSSYDISIFILKNVIMIYIAVKECYTRVQYYRQKRADEKGGELMGKHHALAVSDEENAPM